MQVQLKQLKFSKQLSFSFLVFFMYFYWFFHFFLVFDFRIYHIQDHKRLIVFFIHFLPFSEFTKLKMTNVWEHGRVVLLCSWVGILYVGYSVRKKQLF